MARALLVPLMLTAIAVRAYGVGLAARETAEADRLAGSSGRTLGLSLVWRLNGARPAPPTVVDGLPLVLTPVALADAVPGLRAVGEALAAYPDGFVGRHLRAAYVVGDLRYGDQRGGGANYADTIYVTADRLGDEGSVAYTRRTVFHEMASLLLARAGFDRQRWEGEWRALNPAGTRYVADGGGPLAIGGDAAIPAARMGMGYDPDLFPSGFLSAYGRASVRADFDTYSDAMFTAPADLRRWMSASPRVRAKVGLAEHTYLAADPRFAELFARLGVPLVGG